MVRIVKTIELECRAQFGKALYCGLKSLDLYPLTSKYYEIKIRGLNFDRYYVRVRCDSEEEKTLLDWLNNVFKPDVTVTY